MIKRGGLLRFSIDYFLSRSNEIFVKEPVAAQLRALRPAPTSKKDTLILREELKH